MTIDIVRIIREHSKPLFPVTASVDPDISVDFDLKALIFDIYGTLFISESGDRSELDSDDFSLFSSVLTMAGIVIDAPSAGERACFLFDDEIRRSHRLSRKRGIPYPEVEIRDIWLNVLSSLREMKMISSQPHPATASACAVCYEILSNPVYPMPGLSELLFLARRCGIPLGIVSNAQFYTPYLFSAFLDAPPEDLGFLPDLCFWSYVLGRAKPDIFLYERLCRALEARSIPVQQVLYVGNDMLNDVVPASALGLKTALFAGDKRSLRMREKELFSKDVKSDIIITDFSQLYPIIQGSCSE